MHLLRTLLLPILAAAFFPLATYAAPGDLDLSFGTGGKTTSSIGNSNDFVSSLVVQSDGKIVVGGNVWNGFDNDFGLVRFASNGTLDAGFGSGGKVVTAIQTSHDECYGLALQTDGKILAAGLSQRQSASDFALVRYNSNGTIDTSFGTGSPVITAFGISAFSGASSVALQPDGKIVVAGYSGDDIAVVRYQSNGTLDTGFGAAGKVVTHLGGIDRASSVAIQSDGRIVVAGHNGSDFAVARYNANGTLDSSFGSGGKVTTPISAGADASVGLVLQADGKIVVAGNYSSGSGAALVRYHPNGSLDSSFGAGGILTVPVVTGRAVALQGDGKILLAGYDYNGGTTDFLLMQFTPAVADVHASGQL